MALKKPFQAGGKNSWYFWGVKCQYCKSSCIKYGKQHGIQRYRCKKCKRVQLAEYKNKAWQPFTKELFKRCLACSGGVRSMGYTKQVSKPTILKWLREGKKFTCIDKSLIIPNDEYELDEMWTYVGNKDNECWVIYVISRTTRLPVALKVGRRNKENLKEVVNQLLLLNPKRIYTDGLKMYKELMPKSIHRKGKRKINYIERKNITNREQIKRLSRDTISFSKKEELLDCPVRWYFFGWTG